MEHTFLKSGVRVNKVEIHGTNSWIFGILRSKSKWELPFLAKGNARFHPITTGNIKTEENHTEHINASHTQQTHWQEQQFKFFKIYFKEMHSSTEVNPQM